GESRSVDHIPIRHLAAVFIRSANRGLLERKLQGKLYLSRRPRGSQIAELLCPKNGGVVSILWSAIGKQEIGVVREIEKLGAKFQIRLLGGMEELECREVPGLVSRCLDGVTADIAEGAKRWIGEGAGIEPCGRCVNFVGSNTSGIARHSARPVWVPDLVRTLGAAAGAAVSIREVAVGIEPRIPLAGGDREDAGNLPPSDHLVRKSGRVPR